MRDAGWVGWAGTTLGDRREARRARLLEVGLELLGREGAGAVTVRSVCRHAKLTDRYFYESFPDRSALLVAVFEEVATEARQAIAEATDSGPAWPAAVARRAVEAFLGVLLDDPRKGRVLLLESFTEPALSRRAFELQPLFTDLIRAHLASPTHPEAEMTATALIGALANLFRRWLDGDLPADRAAVTDYVVQLLLVLAIPQPASAGDAG